MSNKGPEVEKLEVEVAQFIGSSFTMVCASGSDTRLLALMSMGGVGSGDEVVTTPFTFVATAGSIARLNAKPVFVDIDPETYNLDRKQLEAAITPKAIIPVHVFGLPAQMGKIMEIARATRWAIKTLPPMLDFCTMPRYGTVFQNLPSVCVPKCLSAQEISASECLTYPLASAVLHISSLPRDLPIALPGDLHLVR